MKSLHPRDLAIIFDRTVRTIREWANQGVIRTYRDKKGNRRFYFCDVEALAKQRGVDLHKLDPYR